MSWASAIGLPLNPSSINTSGNINANGSITANNSFYVNGNGADRYYLSNSGANDDAIYSYSSGGGYFYSLIDTHDQLQIRCVNNTTASVPFVVANNLLNGANVGGTVTFNCIGSNAGAPTNVRPTLSNYSIMTNTIPSNYELITYQDYLNLRGTTTNYTTFQVNHNLTSNVPYTAGVLTIPSAGLYSINTNVAYTASGNITTFQISLTNLPAPYTNASQTIYLDAIPSVYPTIPISAQQQISLTTNAYFSAQTTINLVILSSFLSGNVSLNVTATFPDLYFNALKIG
jgi:hypothetical protein